MVLIWITGCSGPPAVSPAGPSVTSSTAASEGRRVITASEARATAATDAAGVPPMASRGGHALGADVVTHDGVAGGAQTRGDGAAEQAEADDADRGH